MFLVVAGTAGTKNQNKQNIEKMDKNSQPIEVTVVAVGGAAQSVELSTPTTRSGVRIPSELTTNTLLKIITLGYGSIWRTTPVPKRAHPPRGEGQVGGCDKKKVEIILYTSVYESAVCGCTSTSDRLTHSRQVVVFRRLVLWAQHDLLQDVEREYGCPLEYERRPLGCETQPANELKALFHHNLEKKASFKTCALDSSFHFISHQERVRVILQ